MSQPNTIAGIMGRLVVQENGCALWPGQTHKGYGRVSYQGKKVEVHRLLYEHFVGAVPEGLHLDHVHCQAKACGNFAHMEPVTPVENLMRSPEWNGHKTHCPKGHAYDGENVLLSKSGSRNCRECNRASSRRYKARKRSE